jgi:hypothetical protein
MIDPSRCRPSALSSPGSPDERAGSLRRGEPGTVRSLGQPGPVARGAERVSDRTVRVDRAAPVIHHTMRAAQAKPQVSDPDEFSAPTSSSCARRRDRSRTRPTQRKRAPLAMPEGRSLGPAGRRRMPGWRTPWPRRLARLVWRQGGQALRTSMKLPTNISPPAATTKVCQASW